MKKFVFLSFLSSFLFCLSSYADTEHTFSPFGSDLAAEDVTKVAQEEGIPRPQFFSREDWGADESLRILPPNKRQHSGITWFEEEIRNVADRLKPHVVKKTDEEDQPLFWPIAENPEVYKFAVHHTGEYLKENRSPVDIMRAIYYYHTVTKGWGDIGYNYVIDKQGNIYEGRAGGPKAVGAHVMYHNIGTIGISLMGNFQHEKPTPAQLKVLTLLIADHAKRFNVDPTARSFYLRDFTYNVDGHRNFALRGHGTACPGRYLQPLLPKIRKEASRLKELLIAEEKRRKRTARDFLQKSEAAPKVQQISKFERKDDIRPPLDVIGVVKPLVIQRGNRGVMELEVRNNTNSDWPRNAVIDVLDAPEGATVTRLRADDEIPYKGKGTFKGSIRIKDTPNGLYNLTLNPVFLKEKVLPHQYERISMYFPIQVSGDKKFFANAGPTNASKTISLKDLQASTFSAAPKKQQQPSTLPENDEPTIKVKLSFFDENYADFVSKSHIQVFDERNERVAMINPGTPIRAIASEADGEKYLTINADRRSWKLDHAKLIATDEEGVFEISNYRYGNGAIKYNKFRRQINIYPEGERKLLLVNQLPLEEYLAGLSEEPKTEPEEKRKAILILARSYGLVYSGEKRKFQTLLYDLEDSPKTSQFYLGYDWESYHHEQKKLVEATKGLVLTYGGTPVIGPYFTQSSGHSSGKWKSAYPWAKVQELPYDKDLEPRGHGVGLSGNSARVLGEQGKSYSEILDYFFDGTHVTKVY